MDLVGRIKYVTKGAYDPEATYGEMNVVLYGGSLWEAIKETTGNAPPQSQQNEDGTPASNEFWKLFLPGALGSEYVKKTDLSAPPTETEPGKPGVNYPDGKTITIDENGMLTGAPTGRSLTKEEMDTQLADGTLEDGSAVYLSGNEQDGDRGNMVGLIIDGQFVPYGMVGLRDGVPVYLFNTYEEYEVAKPNLVDPCVFITLDDLDTGGWTFDDALDTESENAVQNKVIANAINQIQNSMIPKQITFVPNSNYVDSSYGVNYMVNSVTGMAVFTFDILLKNLPTGTTPEIGTTNFMANRTYATRFFVTESKYIDLFVDTQGKVIISASCISQSDVVNVRGQMIAFGTLSE